MTPRMGFEVFVAGLQRDLAAAEQKLQRLHMDRLTNCGGAVTMPEPPNNKADIAQVEAEISTLKAEIAKHTWPD